MSFQISVSIGYRDIFDDYETVDIKELIKDIPTKNALEIIGYFLAQLHTLERDPTKQIEFLKLWLGRLPISVHKRINDFITKISANPNADNTFLPLVLASAKTHNMTSVRLLQKSQNIACRHHEICTPHWS